MHTLGYLGGLALIGGVVWDAFETIVLPRTVRRRFRLARLYFRTTWRLWTRTARLWRSDGRQERFLAMYGPLFLLGLLMVWAAGLILGFAALHWAARSTLQTPTGPSTFADALYMSGTTFFTLGLGDVHPIDATGRVLTVVEGGVGLGLFAMVIAYFPVLYQSFSRREARLTLLDAWAGSPPSAGEVLRRLSEAGRLDALEPFLRDWEYWCSELLEGHISYPVVAFFRSQHQRQSWISALTTILDLSALVESGIEGVPPWQAHLTFAIARHAAVDLAQVFRTEPGTHMDRLPPDALEQLRSSLEAAGLRPARASEADARLHALRDSYEPYVAGLGRFLMMPLPAWWHADGMKDNWQSSPRQDGDSHL